MGSIVRRITVKFEHVFVIGVGGIGSHVVEPLSRLLAYHPEGTRNVVLIDGDTFEEKNRIRQLFPARFVDTNKAEAMAAVIEESLFPVQFVAEYVDTDKFSAILKESGLSKEDNFLVITSVDNDATRKAICDCLEKDEYQNFAHISPGNGEFAGQVVVDAKQNGKRLTTNPVERYPQFKYPDDAIPGTGCQTEAPSTPQLITANAFAALGVLTTVYSMLSDKPWWELVQFDSEVIKMKPLGSSVSFSTENREEKEVEV